MLQRRAAGQAPGAFLRTACASLLLATTMAAVAPGAGVGVGVGRARCLCGFVVGGGCRPPRMPLAPAPPTRPPWGAGRRRGTDGLALPFLCRGVTTGATTPYVSGWFVGCIWRRWSVSCRA